MPTFHQIFRFFPLLLIIILLLYIGWSSRQTQHVDVANDSVEPVILQAETELGTTKVLGNVGGDGELDEPTRIPAPVYPESVVFENPTPPPREQFQKIMKQYQFCDDIQKIRKGSSGIYITVAPCDTSISGLFLISSLGEATLLFDQSLGKIQDFELLINKQIKVLYQDENAEQQETIISLDHADS